MLMRPLAAVAILLAALVTSAAARADTIRVDFTGTVIAPDFPGVSLGDAATGYFTYDTTAAPSSPTASARHYDGATGLLAIDGMTWFFDDGRTLVEDRSGPITADAFQAFISPGVEGPGTFPSSTLQIGLIGPNTLLPSAEQPTLDTLAGFDRGYVHLSIVGDDHVYVDMTSFTAALLTEPAAGGAASAGVPEPGPVGLLGLALTALWRWQRRSAARA